MDNVVKSLILTPFNIMYKISPKYTLQALFRLKMGYSLHLYDPQTYNEKIQWIKLYDHNPLMPQCCDKYSVRQYIENKGYGDLLNTLIWDGFDPNDIPFDKLPDKFVIKVTHGSSFNIICTDKNNLDRDEVIKKCTKWLIAKFLPCYGEWFYGKVKPRIVIEDYISATNEYGVGLLDYKLFCFNGKVKCIYVSSSKDSDESYYIDYYDENWKWIPLSRKGHKSLGQIEKPACFSKMIEIAEDLAKDFLHVRVDFFYEGGKLYFGEMTFTTSAGFGKIDPIEFDYKMGSWLKLPIKEG